SVAGLNAQVILDHAGIKAVLVPAQGNQVKVLLYANDIQLLSDTLSGAIQDVKAGKARALAVFSDTRTQALPDTPAFTELGFPKMVGVWWAFNVGRARRGRLWTGSTAQP